MLMMELKHQRLVTGLVRFHFVNLFEPREAHEGSVPKYGVCLLIPKEDEETLDKIEDAFEVCILAAAELYPDNAGKGLRMPLRDGDIERRDRPEFAGNYFINATTKFRPEVVDENCFDITDPEEVYPGCYGRASIKFFLYNREGVVGVGCSLNHIQKLEDGEKLDVQVSAAEDFRPAF